MSGASSGLQRSAISFRRQGSSGLVWDDKLVSGELNKPGDDHHDHQDEAGPSDQKKGELRRTKSDGGGRRAYRTVKVEQAEDPPSPRLSACGFCSVFGKTQSPAAKNAKRKSGKHK